MENIDKGVRATNYLIDMIIISLVWIGTETYFPNFMDSGLFFYILFFLYYFILEITFKQTLGKMITKTSVVKKNGSRANFLNILMRSTWRLIPFDAISYLFGTERGFHDRLSTTKLIKKID